MTTDQDEIRKALNEIKTEVKSVSEKVIELSVINRNHENTSLSNSQRLNPLSQTLILRKAQLH